MDLHTHKLAFQSPIVAGCEDATRVVGTEVAPLVGKILKAERRARGLVGVLPVDEDCYARHV